MADENRSKDVSGHSEHSGSTSPPPLPRPEPDGDNVRPVPLWERDFCRFAYGIPWETFCKYKQFNGLYRKVLDWDDSGAFKNFEEAKERFRAQYNGEPFEDPVLDPDMYIDEVDHLCIVDPELTEDLNVIAGQAGLDLVSDLGNKKPEAVRGAQPYCTRNNMNSNFFGGGSSSNWHQQEVNPRHTSSLIKMKVSGGDMIWVSGGMKWTGGVGSSSGGGGGNGRNWNGGGGGNGRNPNGGGGGNGRNWNGGGGGNGRNQNGGGGRGRNWNCFGGGSGRGRIWGGGNQRNQDEGQRQQRNQDERQHQMRSGGGQPLQGQWRRKLEWRLVQQNRAPPKDGPAA